MLSVSLPTQLHSVYSVWASSHRMETHPPPFRDKEVTNSLPFDSFKNSSLKGFFTDTRSVESKQQFS